MRRVTVLLLWLAPGGLAQITNLRVLGTTATQAVIAYTAPTASACTVEVSESSAYVPLARDIDPALFTGANLDNREGSLSNGRQRVVVIGKRTTQWATDGKSYSLALQADTFHYYRITCGPDQAAGTFRTANIPLGTTYTDPLPYDRNHWEYHSSGYLAYPSFLGADNESVIDPQTGALIRRWTKVPGAHDYNWVVMAVSAIRDLNAAWGDSEAGLLTRTIANDTNYAIYSSANRDPLMVVLDGSKPPFTSSATYSLDYLTISVIGWGAASAAEDRTLEACLTVDGVSCYGPWVDIPLPAGDPGAAAVTTATTKPYLWDWTPPGNQPPGPGDYARRSSGTVSISGSTVTASASGAFLPTWSSGSRITINGVERRIAGITDDRTLTLSAAPGDGASLAWSAFNFGFLMRKKTAAAGQITIDRISVIGRTTGQGGWTTAGSEDVCAWVQSPRDGVPGYHCLDRSGSSFYWVSAVDGASRLLGAAWTTPPGAMNTIFVGTGLDPSHSGTIYALANTAAGSKVVAKWQYTGTNQENLASVSDGSDGGLIAAGKAQVATLTPVPRDIYTLAAEFSATSPVGDVFDRSKYGCDMAGVLPDANGSVIALRCLLGSQDTLGWVVMFDPDKVDTAEGCVGKTIPGSPGCVVAAISSTRGVTDLSQGSPVFHWGMLHSVGAVGGDGWKAVSPNQNEAPTSKGGGPYRSLVTGTVVPATTTIVLESDAYDPSPATGETGQPGEYTTISPGDILCLTTNPSALCQWVGYLNTQGGTENEAVRVLTKTVLDEPAGCSPTACTPGVDCCHVQITVSRNQNFRPEGANDWTGLTVYAYAIGNSTYAMAAGNHYANPVFWWDYVNDPHGLNLNNTMRPDPGNPSHLVYKRGYCVATDLGGYKSGSRSGAMPGMIASTVEPGYLFTPTFSGAAGEGGMEGHPNWSQTDASASEQSWYLDLRPSLQGQLSGTVTVSRISGSLFSVTVGSGKYDPKKLPLMAFCGPQPLKDVSSPATGNILATDNSTPYQVCVPLNANECRTGSVPFNGVTNRVVYVNCPYVTDTGKILVSGNAQSNQAMIQAGIPAGSNNRRTRIITSGFGRYYNTSPYWSARSLPNGSWALFQAPLVNGQRTDLLAVKLPPWPGGDSSNRGTFVPVQVRIASIAAGADNVIAEFGYDPEFHCASRREACVAARTTIDEAVPFYWLAETYSGVPCAGGCTIDIPALPHRVLYYRLKYRTAAGSLVATGPAQIAVAGE